MENGEFLPSTTSAPSLVGFSIDSFPALAVDVHNADEDVGYGQIQSALAVTEMELRREMAEIQEAQERELQPSALPDFPASFHEPEVDDQQSEAGMESEEHGVASVLSVMPLGHETAMESVTDANGGVIGSVLSNVASQASTSASSGSYTVILDSSLLDTSVLASQAYHTVHSLPLTTVEPFDSRICNSTDVRLLESHIDIGDGGSHTVTSVDGHLTSDQTCLTVVASHGSWTSETSTVDVRDIAAGPDRLDSVDVVEQPLGSTATTDEHGPGVMDAQAAAGTTEERKAKRRGGWPKGKKRKKQVLLLNPPKAPVTGYIHFLNAKRAEVKSSHPDMTYAEVTRLLGAEWSNLCPETKQKYLDDAEADRKRYIQELEIYQQSTEYQEFVKRRQMLTDGANYNEQTGGYAISISVRCITRRSISLVVNISKL